MKDDIYSWNPIRVPVKLVDGHLEYFYGGLLPVKNGTVGDLLVSKDAIDDKEFLATLQRKSAHKILDSDTELLVALTIKQASALDANLVRHLLPNDGKQIPLGDTYYYTERSPQTKFVRIKIVGPTERQKKTDPKEKGGVWLHLEGLLAKGITTSTVKIPDEVSTTPADSLNHAFTLLSEKYEPWRKSHTGNIYDRILYKEKSGKWYPLDVLRSAAIAKDEHELIREQWVKISEKLKLQMNTSR